MLHLKPLADLGTAERSKSFKVFLSGSIDMGAARDWRSVITGSLKGLEVIVLDPLRAKWDLGIEYGPRNLRGTAQAEW